MTTKLWLDDQLVISYFIYQNMNETSEFINIFKFNEHIDKRWFGWDR